MFFILWFSALFFAINNASFEISIDKTLDFLISIARVIPIHPDPVPISIIKGFFFLKRFLIAASISISVSGLGIRTLLLTK